jgi:hypothetical protein
LAAALPGRTAVWRSEAERLWHKDHPDSAGGFMVDEERLGQQAAWIAEAPHALVFRRFKSGTQVVPLVHQFLAANGAPQSVA